MDDEIERIARLLYEEMALRVCLDPARLNDWETQSDKVREDWRNLALKARELAGL